MTDSALVLGTQETAEIHAHLLRAYPDEGCGVLLGAEREGRRQVARIVALENQHTASRHNRYTISPVQFLAAEREGRDLGLDVLGFFHSHPDHPAEPSAFDLEHAWPYYSYLIVSVREGRIDTMRSFRLTDDRSRFEPESLELADNTGPRASAGELA